MLSATKVTLEVFCHLSDEYSRWMTRDPLLQPSVDHLWRRYHGLIPAAILGGGGTDGLDEVLLGVEAKHRRQIEAQIRSGYTPRTLDLMLVLLCREGLAVLPPKENNSNSAGSGAAKGHPRTQWFSRLISSRGTPATSCGS